MAIVNNHSRMQNLGLVYIDPNICAFFPRMPNLSITSPIGHPVDFFTINFPVIKVSFSRDLQFLQSTIFYMEPSFP